MSIRFRKDRLIENRRHRPEKTALRHRIMVVSSCTPNGNNSAEIYKFLSFLSNVNLKSYVSPSENEKTEIRRKTETNFRYFTKEGGERTLF